MYHPPGPSRDQLHLSPTLALNLAHLVSLHGTMDLLDGHFPSRLADRAQADTAPSTLAHYPAFGVGKAGGCHGWLVDRRGDMEKGSRGSTSSLTLAGLG